MKDYQRSAPSVFGGDDLGHGGNATASRLPPIALAILAVWLTSARPAASFEFPIVLTRVPTNAVSAQGVAHAHVLLVSPNGQTRVLSSGFESAGDPNVSFDGTRVLFAGRQARSAPWRIWEIGVDGQGLRPVSPEHLDARDPIYVSTLFTLDSPEPWFTAVFVAHERTVNELGQVSASSLYNVKLDGTELRRLTYNPNHNFDPFQMWDGRVIYSAERHPNEPGLPGGRIGLHAIHVEGADMEFYGGGLGQRIQRMACATAGGLVVFVESNEPTGDGAGQLAAIEERRPHATYRSLTKDPAHVFLHPSPLRDNQVLVARRPVTGEGTCGVFRFDADTGQCESVFDSPEFHELQAVAVQPRPRPDGHSTVVKPQLDFGTFYGLNCYTTDPMREAHLKPGAVKRVRLIEGMVRKAEASPLPDAVRWPFVPRRLIGEAPVEADGSFNVNVPADTPILLQTLDDRGLALGTCGWIWVKPNENRGCIGCHEDPELIPENEYVLALRRPSNRLVLPPAQRRNVAFREDIAPILQQHCATAECHGGTETPLHLPLTANPPAAADLAQAYASLLIPSGTPSEESAARPYPGRYVDAGRARTSWLVWQLLGTNTARPWDKGEPSSNSSLRKVSQMPPAGKGNPLRDETIRTIIQWIDMGAQFEAVKDPEPEKEELVETKW